MQPTCSGDHTNALLEECLEVSLQVLVLRGSLLLVAADELLQRVGLTLLPPQHRGHHVSCIHSFYYSFLAPTGAL